MATTVPPPAVVPKPARKIMVTAAEGLTGRYLIDLLMTEPHRSRYLTLTALCFSIEAAAGFADYPGLNVVVYDPTDRRALRGYMEAWADTCMLIPPARKDKAEITRTLIDAAKAARNVHNLVFLSAAGCDYAEYNRQPRLREFIDLEAAVMAAHPEGPPASSSHSTCIVRAGFYAENILLYSREMNAEGRIPIPIDDIHRFAPVAVADVVAVCAYCLTSVGPQGLAEGVRDEVLTVTGPELVSGRKLAEAASQNLGMKLVFESISEGEAMQILKAADPLVDDSEKEYILEYYSLVRAGRTNYVSNTPMMLFYGHRGIHPGGLFMTYSSLVSKLGL
ncbi:NAD(P)-binding protein [Phanerochaete sordida]|uniref:NAD(P)-binding protein n=1 Tax=Phanerochaete sordida TaxID=48140 RepID=A0A9P3GCZ4_9APHY|nr:NAD(P)-binding protein [Phanerochaete sordida]